MKRNGMHKGTSNNSFWRALTAIQFLLGIFIFVILIGGCASDKVKPFGSGAIQERRARILEIAESYLIHEWRASEKNVFHGMDPNGVLINTPDIAFDEDGWFSDGRVNVGIPYMWGGYSTIKGFDQGIAEGKYAGNIPKNRSAGTSLYCVGVDCSGYVSRCWELEEQQSTRSIGRFCIELDSYEELLPGDIANSYDRHVVLFKEFVDDTHDKIRVYEATPPKVIESIYSVEKLKSNGYKPLRYKKLDIE
ncbi:MAG: hypothetical protein JXD22_02320 [Sedimentisphaerales bacterium]|nr:hypothetical protein [Sedimentisphaerales bacterium]